MKIRELFRKPIERPINGVIKADQRDDSSVWQELDEYVVTTDILDYFRRFFAAYLNALDNPRDRVLTDRMGVWVSGFFGSGKSHFIKILSYLLEDHEARNPVTGERKRASAFFDEHKIKDPILLADIQRATRGSADVILFNIDAKADSKSERDVILQVFLRVFNEKLGFSGDAPHIAEMERYLVEKGVFEVFTKEFERLHGGPWHTERDAFGYLRDEVVPALGVALKMSNESAALWFDDAGNKFKINIEGFAKMLRKYLDGKGPDHRIIFLVDEVGQFIGNNTQLMLTLQTITEQLGTLCQGRAWLVVTSQEDIEAAIGEANKARSQDFSKIQGRFYTRLSLASTKTNEVIGERLLAKTDAAHAALRDVFAQQGDIINNQISFLGNPVTLKTYRDAADYGNNYPFAPYQFQLLQKIFEAIRKVGATGQHLSRGERSLLDAFQSAAKINGERSIQALVPLYDFYHSIENFLDTSVKRAIDQAAENAGLEPQDLRLLKALFLVRHVVDVVKPTIDNLATLCVDQVDADKLQLKRQLQQSLERLERQQLVNRSGDQWFFLTNEERDVAREIGHVEVSSTEKSRLLAEIVFDEILSGQTKVRHRETKGDYDFNRLLDGVPFRNASHALTLDVRTPLGDDYETLKADRCILLSAEGHGRVVLRIAEGERLDVELTLYRQIEKYVDSPKANTAAAPLKKILLERKDENRERRQRLLSQISELMTRGDFYAKGQILRSKSSSAPALLDELMNYLITNTYNKLPYLKVPKADPIAEIRALLAADDLSGKLALNGEEGNPQALDEVRQYLQLAASQNRVLLSDVVARFTDIPYGWKPDWEVVLLVTRLFMAGEIKLTLGGSDLNPRSAFDPLTKAVQHKQISLLKRKTADAGSIGRAADLYKQLFTTLSSREEDALVIEFRNKFKDWEAQLKTALPLASLPQYPGRVLIEALLKRCGRQLGIRDAYEFIEALNTDKDDWLDAGEDFSNVDGFYRNQQPSWQRLLAALARFQPNREALITDAKTTAALKELDQIRDNPQPFAQVQRIDGLIATADSGNLALLQKVREAALLGIEGLLGEVQKDLSKGSHSDQLSNAALYPLQQTKLKISGATSIPEIEHLSRAAGEKLDDAVEMIVAAFHEAQADSKATPVPTSKASTPAPAAAAAIAAAVVIAPKPSQTIRPASVTKRTYLETEAEVHSYLADLKAQLLAVLQAGKRIRIE